MIKPTFINEASSKLGDTTLGLSGSQIVDYLSSYAVEFNVDIPYSSYPFPRDVPNKRSVLKDNLDKFNSKQQYKIIKELCELDKFKNNSDVKNLKIQLVTRYKDLAEDNANINEILIEETKYWLDDFPDALPLYTSALEKYNNSIFERNILDDLRLALELLIKKILENNKSLENQLSTIGSFIKTKGGSVELSNMFCKLIDYYTKYQNSYVKHNDKVKEEEIDFLFEITSSFMKHFIRLNQK